MFRTIIIIERCMQYYYNMSHSQQHAVTRKMNHACASLPRDGLVATNNSMDYQPKATVLGNQSTFCPLTPKACSKVYVKQ